MRAAPTMAPDDLGRRVLAHLRGGRDGWLTASLTIVLIAVALGVSALLLTLTGASPSASLSAIWTGSLANTTGWTTTLLNAAPLLLVRSARPSVPPPAPSTSDRKDRCSSAVCFGAWVGLRLALPGPMLVVVVMAAAAVGGGLWAALSALMYRFRGVNVVVSTLLMTFLAIQLVTFAVSTPWLQESAQGSSGIADAQSNPLPADALLGGLGQYPSVQLNVGLFLALVARGRCRAGAEPQPVGLPGTHGGTESADGPAHRSPGGRARRLHPGTVGRLRGAGGRAAAGQPCQPQPAAAGLSTRRWTACSSRLVARNRPLIAIPVS
ncbi:hypothetical protein, partial [Streptomyces yanii]|uniref:hypothetical protein n=1 Tax=Streptomyces yanii TaxID=78510 RepID=UPI0031EE2ECF